MSRTLFLGKLFLYIIVLFFQDTEGKTSPTEQLQFFFIFENKY